jgi:hypothetical protein
LVHLSKFLLSGIVDLFILEKFFEGGGHFITIFMQEIALIEVALSDEFSTLTAPVNLAPLIDSFPIPTAYAGLQVLC